MRQERERTRGGERSKPKKKGERVRAALLSHLAHTHTHTDGRCGVEKSRVRELKHATKIN